MENSYKLYQELMVSHFKLILVELPIVEITDFGMSINGTLEVNGGLTVPGVLYALVGEQGSGMVMIEYDTTIRGGLSVGGDA